MKLFTEFVDMKNLKVINESVDNAPPRYRVEGPFLEADSKNVNGRDYPLDVYTEAVEKYNTERIATHRSMGLLDHVNTPQIILDRVSHLITSLVMQDKFGMGSAKLLETPMGQIATALVKEGVVLGMSTCSLGNADDNGKVKKGLQIVRVDLCSDPSHPKALVEAIQENREWIIDASGNYVEQQIDNMKKQADKKFNDAIARDLFIELIRNVG
jgi:hypothetical protein